MRIRGIALHSLFCAMQATVVGCRPEPESGPPPIELADLGDVVEFGNDATGNEDAVLHHPEDAVFFGGSIAVLDRSAPFIRLYSRQGQYISALAREGGGPGEAEDPVALDATPDHLVMTERRRISVLDRAGQPVQLVRSRKGMFRGAVWCGASIYALQTQTETYQPTGEISLLNASAPHDSVILSLDTLRLFSQQPHPLFADAFADSILLYTEDFHVPRLVVLPCHQGTPRSIRVDSVGRPEWLESIGSGRWALHPAEPPHPSGLAALPTGYLWATRILRQRGAHLDSVTALTLYDRPTLTPRTVTVRGWLLLVDRDSAGATLWIRHDDDRGSTVITLGPQAIPAAFGRAK